MIIRFRRDRLDPCLRRDDEVRGFLPAQAGTGSGYLPANHFPGHKLRGDDKGYGEIILLGSRYLLPQAQASRGQVFSSSGDVL
jgi:hypothetical protein